MRRLKFILLGGLCGVPFIVFMYLTFVHLFVIWYFDDDVLDLILFRCCGMESEGIEVKPNAGHVHCTLYRAVLKHPIYRK